MIYLPVFTDTNHRDTCAIGCYQFSKVFIGKGRLPILRSLLVILVATLGVVVPQYAFAVDAAAPVIHVGEPTFDFGTIAQGTRVKHDFEISNSGGSDLIIQSVVPACGCTAAVAQESKVPPGGKTVVHVEFDSSGFSGAKVKEARINSSDPENPSVFITLKGIIEPELALDPPRIQFGEFVSSPDVPLPAMSEKILAKGSTTITGVAAGSKSLEVTTSRSSASEWEVMVRPALGIAPGDIRDRVIISIDKSGEKREVSIPVIGRAIGPIVLRPSSLAMGVIGGDQPIERRMQIESRRTIPFKISKIESDNPAVTVLEKNIESGKNSVLVVTVDPKKVKGDLRSTVTLLFDDTSLSPLQFGVYGVQPPNVE